MIILKSQKKKKKTKKAKNKSAHVAVILAELDRAVEKFQVIWLLFLYDG